MSLLKVKPQLQKNRTKLSFSSSPQILENEDMSGQCENDGSNFVTKSSTEKCEAVSSSGICRVGLMDRRGSLQNPEITKVYVQGRRHSTGQALTYR